MAKRRDGDWPAADWTSLIDIIFQLLIFFMLTLALGTVQKQASSQMEGEEKADLPELPGMAELGEALDLTPGSILIHVDEDKDELVRGNIVVYLLNHEIPSIEEAKKDSSHSAGPFTWDEAYTKLEKKLEFAREYDEPLPRIEMRAFSGTPYGNVLDIMKLCYRDDEDDRINQVYFRFARLSKKVGG